jgi:hypothetical protein
MIIECHWHCKYNKDGLCKQPKNVCLTIYPNGTFNCDGLWEDVKDGSVKV